MKRRVNRSQMHQNALDAAQHAYAIARARALTSDDVIRAALIRWGAILDSTASRLQQMTRGMILYFDGDDQRQAGAYERGER